MAVDNNAVPSDTLQSIIKDMTSAKSSTRALDLRYVHCPAPGLSHARNAGMLAARGDIMCFIDDDAIACPDWLEQIERAYSEHPEAAVVGGHILLQAPDPRPRILKQGRESYWSHFITDYSGYTEVETWAGFPWGANWSARRQPLLEIGGFRTNYGRRGNNYWGGEELVAAAQLHALGYKIAIVPQAQVLHVVNPDRFNRRHLWRTILASTLVIYQAQRDLYVPRQSILKGVVNALRELMHPRGNTVALPVDREVLLMRLIAHIVLAFHYLYDAISDRLRSTFLALHRAG